MGSLGLGGAETLYLTYLKELKKVSDRFSIDVCIFESGKKDLLPEYKELAIDIVQLPGRNSIQKVYSVTKFFIKNRSEYDVVHSQVNLFSGIVLLLAYLFRVEVRIAHSHNTRDNNSRVYQEVMRVLIKVSSTHNISCGPEAGKYLFGTKRKFKILKNVIDVSQYLPINPGAKAVNRTRILHIGRMVPEKNHSFITRLIQLLPEDEFEWTLVGAGELEQEVSLELKRYGNVNYLRSTKDVKSLMHSHHLFILPSLFEGFPMVLVEAQASGMFVLASDRVDHSVQIVEGSCIFIQLNLEKWKTSILANRIEVVSSNRIHKDDIIEGFKRRGFDVRNAVEDLINLYNGKCVE